MTSPASSRRLIAEPSSARARCAAASARAAARAGSEVADELEEIYRARRRAPPRPATAGRRSGAGSRAREFIHCDLHMHTDHSPDCATPVDVLLETARDRGLGAIAITDHNEISGALEAREAREMDGIKVIVSEEVKTAERGRGDRALHRGEDPARHVDGGDDRRDPAPGRARLRAASVRPPALGARLRAPAEGRRGHRHPRGVQRAGRGAGVQRGGRALRRQVPDRGRRRARTATSPRASGA